MPFSLPVCFNLFLAIPNFLDAEGERFDPNWLAR
jgi:hypothetical protein